MTILTLELVGLLLAAFKVPRWVSNIGSIALCAGLLNTLLGLFNVFSMLQLAGDISYSIVYAGCKGTLIGIIYGILIYVVSRIVKIVLSPRM
ncbi:MAG: hypothetical protein R3Y04_04170 [Rikenellaceae bacterium]